MALCYKKRWKLQFDRDGLRSDLREETDIVPETRAKTNRGKHERLSFQK